MANIFNEDFREFIAVLNEYKVNYILVEGFAVILHGYRRTTGELDVWITPTEENFNKLRIAISVFGLPGTDLTAYNFLKNDNIEVFTYGRPPVSIEIMKSVKGLSFEEAYKDSKIFSENNLQIRYLHLNDLIAAKKTAGRFKDLDDLSILDKQESTVDLHLRRDNILSIATSFLLL